jgi:outer membrane protein OmpA-like peptidoglycan-associated protein
MTRLTPLLTPRRRLAGFVVGLGLAGCAAPPVVAPPAPATIEPPAVAAGTGPARTGGAAFAWSDKMAASAQRLRGSLQGNNVAVSQTTDLRLWVSLPADVAFATGRAAVRPPATAWLDQVAVALRDLPRAEVQIVSDADAAGNDNAARVLALDRAAAARDWLVIRGVAPQRIGVAGRGGRAATPADQRRLDILIGERTRSVVEPTK